MTDFRSHHALKLIADAGFPLLGDSQHLSQENFLHLKASYEEWSRKRDANLLAHLNEKSTSFRVAPPYGDRVFGIAHNVSWYFDEVLVRDPITAILKQLENAPVHEQIQGVVRTAQLLMRSRSLLEAGYVLLYGPSAIPFLPENTPDQYKELAKIPSLRSALIQAAHCGLARTTLPTGQTVDLYQVNLDGAGVIGVGKVKLAAGESLAIPLNAQLPKVTPEELIRTLGKEVFERLDGTFAREIYYTAQATQNAGTLKASSLFDHVAHEAILNHLHDPKNRAQQDATIRAFNLALPYLKNISSEQLMELRGKMPNAFLEFRSSLALLATQSTKEGSHLIPEGMELEVSKSITSLESELQAVLKKERWKGYAGLVTAGLGTLAGIAFSNPTTAIASIATGAMAVASARGEYSSTLTRLSGRPFSFLWLASKTPKK